MALEGFLSHLESLLPVRQDEPLSRHTTLHIGGPAEAYVQVQSCQELRAVAALAHHWEVPTSLLGAGSNLLAGDKGISGLVIETWTNRDLPRKDLPPIKDRHAISPVILRVFSGMPLPRLAYQTARAGLAGLEWAVGIPGTVGGAVVNNAGAHGGAMADVLRSVLVLGPKGEQVFTDKELGLGYRSSNFRGPWCQSARAPVILMAELRLMPEAPEAIEARISEHIAYRRATQPSQRSIGSIFKNPKAHAAGWLIEQAGLKGNRIGDAQISTKHANFIVNRGHASAAEVNELICLAQAKVRETFGITLELEIQRVGEGF